MKKRFKTRKKRRKIKGKMLFFITFTFISLIVTLKYLSSFYLPFKNKQLVTALITNDNVFLKHKSNCSYFYKVMTKLIDVDFMKPVTILNANYKGLSKGKPVTTVSKSSKTEPLIYLYNTHDSEEYRATSFAEYSVVPTVKLADYVLKEQLLKKKLSVVIEDSSIYEVRKSLNLNYAGSYLASRTLMENAKRKYPSLKYLIDIHRDSINYDKTTITYQNKKYARFLFLVGLENENYQENLEFSNKISEKLNSMVPTISKGIYKKAGENVNGVYNQDFSNRTILIEIGGSDNTIDEVYESLLVLSEVLSEVIRND